MNQKDYRTSQKESYEIPPLTAEAQALLQSLHENGGRSLHQQSLLSIEYRQAALLLPRIFEVLQLEVVENRDDLPTSFVDVENEIAKCMQVCLKDAPVRKRRIEYIQSLVADYRVVSVVLGKNPSVSLHKVHLIVQDNFPNSSLCLLLNILLAGWRDVTTKVIDF